MKTSPARRPPGASSSMSRVVLERRAERREGVEVRVEAPAADDVAAGRRHAHAAEAREQRAGEQERRADALGELAVDDGVSASTSAAHSATSCSPSHSTRTPSASSSASIASTSPIRGTLRTTTSSSVRTEAARIGRAPFLLPAGTIVPDSATPPSMTNFSMSGRLPATRAGPEGWARVTAMPSGFRATRPGPCSAIGSSRRRCAAIAWPSRPRCARMPSATATTRSCGRVDRAAARRRLRALPDMDDAERGHPRTIMAELERRDAPPEMVRAIASHARLPRRAGRESPMERTLVAVDELCGFLVACAYVRPEGIHGLTPKSVKKKLKQPSFAAAVNRDDVRGGAERLGVDFDEHVAFVIAALEARADELELHGRARPRQSSARVDGRRRSAAGALRSAATRHADGERSDAAAAERSAICVPIRPTTPVAYADTCSPRSPHAVRRRRALRRAAALRSGRSRCSRTCLAHARAGAAAARRACPASDRPRRASLTARGRRRVAADASDAACARAAPTRRQTPRRCDSAPVPAARRRSARRIRRAAARQRAATTPRGARRGASDAATLGGCACTPRVTARARHPPRRGRTAAAQPAPDAVTQRPVASTHERSSIARARATSARASGASSARHDRHPRRRDSPRPTPRPARGASRPSAPRRATSGAGSPSEQRQQACATSRPQLRRPPARRAPSPHASAEPRSPTRRRLRPRRPPGSGPSMRHRRRPALAGPCAARDHRRRSRPDPRCPARAEARPARRSHRKRRGSPAAPTTTTGRPRAARCLKKPAASYSPGPLRAKYHRR